MGPTMIAFYALVAVIGVGAVAVFVVCAVEFNRINRVLAARERAAEAMMREETVEMIQQDPPG